MENTAQLVDNDDEMTRIIVHQSAHPKGGVGPARCSRYESDSGVPHINA